MANKVYSKITGQDLLMFCGKKLKTVPLVHDLCETKIAKRRINRIEKHIKNHNYFEMLAVILKIMSNGNGIDQKKVIQDLICDLSYVQTNYKLVKKD